MSDIIFIVIIFAPFDFSGWRFWGFFIWEIGWGGRWVDGGVGILLTIIRRVK